MSDTVKYLLGEESIPKSWYNIAADLPKALPPVLHPGTKKPIGPDDLLDLAHRADREAESAYVEGTGRGCVASLTVMRGALNDARDRAARTGSQFPASLGSCHDKLSFS